MENDKQQPPKQAKTRKQKIKGILMIFLILLSFFSIIPMLFLQTSFAQTQVYQVTNTIWINATGISPSSLGDEPNFQPIKCVVSQTARRSDGGVSSLANEGDRGFSPTVSQEYLMFKDLTQAYSLSTDPNFPLTTNAERYVGLQWYNGTMNLTAMENVRGLLPAAPIGASVQEVALVFDTPAKYAEDYCLANGYTYQNVINSTYEQSININHLNTYRSKFLQSVMYTGEKVGVGASSLDADVHQSIIGIDDAYYVAMLVLGISIIVGLVVYALTYVAPPELMTVDSPSTDPLVNMTIIAMERFSHDSDQALQAYINGSLSWDQYIWIINTYFSFYSGLVNATTFTTADLWRDYYNTSETLYNTYADMYDKYTQTFAASWTDWLTTILILIIIIIVCFIIYKVVARKKGIDAASMPQINVIK